MIRTFYQRPQRSGCADERLSRLRPERLPDQPRLSQRGLGQSLRQADAGASPASPSGSRSMPAPRASAACRLQEMITYALLGGAVTGAIRYEAIIGGIGNALKTGDVAVWLLKPVSFPLYIIVSELGRVAYRFLFMVVPTVAVVALIYGMQPPAIRLPRRDVRRLLAPRLSRSSASSRRCSASSPSGSSPRSRSNGRCRRCSTCSRAASSRSGSSRSPSAAIARHLPFAWIVYYPSAVWLGRLIAGGNAHSISASDSAGPQRWPLGVAWLWRKASTRIIVQGG